MRIAKGATVAPVVILIFARPSTSFTNAMVFAHPSSSTVLELPMARSQNTKPSSSSDDDSIENYNAKTSRKHAKEGGRMNPIKPCFLRFALTEEKAGYVEIRLVSSTYPSFSENKQPNRKAPEASRSFKRSDAKLFKSDAVVLYEQAVERMHTLKRAIPMLSKQEHLRVLYSDEALVVVDKPSGVLTVPDINNNPSLLDLVWEEYGPDEGGVNHVGDDVFHQPSCMIVNRLDMDTSGIVVFGRNAEATRSLNQAFRERRVLKEYEAVLCGHLPYSSGLIDLPLQKCHTNPPFMRVSTPSSELASNQLIEDLIEAGYKRMGRKQPKHSQTEFEVLERTYYESDPQLPITRVRLKPLTGRTHQLRVHLAAIGFPILGDASYGISGSAATVGGLHGVDIQEPAGFGRASIGLQEALAQRHPPNAKSMCLHAALLRLIHPVVGELVEWKATVPF